MKKILILYAAVVLIVLFAWLDCFIVREAEYAIVTKFGRPLRTIENPGLFFKLPDFIHKVNRFEKRTKVFESQMIQLLLGDQNPIIAGYYVAWKIDDPLVFFQSVNNPENAELKLSDMINSQLGNILGEYNLENIINTNPEKLKLEEINQKVLKTANERIKKRYGIEIVQIGQRRLAYPSVVSAAVYRRMKAERLKVASKYRAEGQQESEKIKAKTDKEAQDILSEAYKQSEIIKGQGDKEAMKTYIEAYGKDPEFFNFTKSLDAYEKILDENTVLILSTDSELFRYLNMKDQTEKE